MDTLILDVASLPTPVGAFAVIADRDGRLRATGWHDDWIAGQGDAELALYVGTKDFRLERVDAIGAITDALRAYFAGDLKAIDAIPVLTAGTPFQREVWQTLREIPAGQVWSYGQMAKKIGRLKAVRAVGQANGANPISIVLPCHRVIGSNGTLTGYGGGMHRKKWLLAHEGYARENLELALE